MIKQDSSLASMDYAVSSHADFDQHEDVVIHDDEVLTAIIAVHNSNLGPATGGCRIYP